MPDSLDLPLISFASRAEMWGWMEEHHGDAGIWLKFARKGSGIPSVTYPEAVEISLCYGWIDAQVKSFDDSFYIQRFVPRRAKSMWSKINRAKAEALIEAGSMREPGVREIERARSDGRWDAAYDSPSTATVPDDLRAALDSNSRANAFFEGLDSINRYAILHRIQTATSAASRRQRLEKLVAMLDRGERIHAT